jgi:hypothetical protein
VDVALVNDRDFQNSRLPRRSSMKISRCIALALSLALLIVASSASAFDGSRRGFVLGGGLGLGLTSYTQELSGGLTGSSDRQNSGAIATTFKIGGGLSERTLLIYQQNQNWFSLTNVFGDDVTVASGSGVLAVNHFVSDESSVYLVGGIGLSSWSLPFEDGSKVSYGGTLLVGAGIEFSPHWSAEFNLSFGNPSYSESGTKLTTKTANLSVTVVGLAY